MPNNNRPLSFISLSHSDNQSESATKFYNSFKADVGGNVLNWLRAYWDLTRLNHFWCPQTSSNFQLIQSIELTKKLWHLAGHCYYYFDSPPPPLCCELVGWGRGHLVYASTSAHDLPRYVWVGWCACVYVCVGACTDTCEHVCVCECERACMRVQATLVFQCASVSLCFVWLSMCSDILLCYCFCVSIYAFHTLIQWQSSLSRSTRTHYLFAAGYSLLTVVVWWCVYH